MRTFKRWAAIIGSILFLTIGFLSFWNYIQHDLFLNSSELELNEHEKVTVHFIHWSEFPKQIFSEFNKTNPNIQVEFERFGIDQYQQVQISRIASGENIDLMGIVSSDYNKFINKRYLVDLTNRVFLKNYESDVIETLSEMDKNKKIYGISYKREVYGVWYNKILFNKYNLEVPKNFTDFIKVCEILKINGVNPLVMGCKDEPSGSRIYYLRLYKGSWKEREWLEKLKTGEFSWTNQEMVSSFKEIDNFLKKGFLLNGSANLTEQQAFNKFVNGQAAMCLMSDASLDMIDPGVDKVCDLGVFPIPYNDKDEPQLVPGTKTGLLIGAFSGSGHNAEAILLLDYLSRTDTAQVYSEITKSKTTVKGVVYEKLKYNELWNPLRMTGLISPLTLAMDSEMQRVLNQSARELLMGESKPEEISETLQRVQREENLRGSKTPKKN